MPDLRSRVVTPYTDPDRFLPEEKALFDKGLCSRQTGFGGWGDPSAWCSKPSKPGASFGNCADHERELLEGHWPDGSPRR